jgi:hypothetical protein
MTLNPVAIAPVVRIVLRYGVGLVFGAELANTIAGDPDLVLLLATAVGIATEAAYAYAKKKGLNT